MSAAERCGMPGFQAIGLGWRRLPAGLSQGVDRPAPMPTRPPPLSCPECGELGLPIYWGLPGWDDSPSGGLEGWEIGGCVVTPKADTHRCPKGHGWRDERYADQGMRGSGFVMIVSDGQ